MFNVLCDIVVWDQRYNDGAGLEGRAAQVGLGVCMRVRERESYCERDRERERKIGRVSQGILMKIFAFL